jgi:hypothetical protein
MPSQQTNPRQRTINWGTSSTLIRQTPSRSTRTVIHDYSQLERPDFTPRNPSREAPIAESSAQPLQDDDIEMEDGDTGHEDNGSSSESQPETPSRSVIYSTVIIRRRQL